MAIFDEIKPAQSNYFRFRLSPEVVISCRGAGHAPGEEMVGDAVELVARHSLVGEKSPYERLLGDAIRGDARLFARDDGVEAARRWSIRYSRASVPVEEYEPHLGPRSRRAPSSPARKAGTDPKPEETRPC